MSWFSNLFSNEAVSLAISEQGTVKPEPYDVIRTKIVSGAVSQQIAIIRNLLLKLPASQTIRVRYISGDRNPSMYGVNNPWPHRQNIHDRLNLLSTTLHQIDVARADMKTLFRIIDLCNETLPSMFRELEIRVGQKDWSTENTSLKRMEQAIDNMLKEIAVLPTHRSILNIEVPANKSSNKTFPDLENYKDNNELYLVLEALKQDWEKASSLPLSAEDDYVIERVGNSYLPDALLLFDRFSHRTGSTNSGKALAIVKEQVGLIHQQVLFVLEQHEEDSFNLMETHTEFLKMKNSRIGIPEDKESKRLQLDSEPPESSL
jgi:hypothetical protein